MKQKEDSSDDPPKSYGRQSYQVQRWRLDEQTSAEDVSSENSENGKENKNNSSMVIMGGKQGLTPWRCGQEWDPNDPMKLGMQCASRATQLFKLRNSLPADHALIQLIHYNVFFSLFHNKAVLEKTALCYTPGRNVNDPWIPFVGEAYPGRAALIPTTYNGLPPSLKPTELQMATVHATWINLVPFPRMRDNLIIWEEIFDHEDFVHNVVGDFIDSSFFSHPGRIPETRRQEEAGASAGGKSKKKKKKKKPEDGAKNGMILWGEAHDVTNWEVTKEFAEKWSWALKGCDDLIVASNRWRLKRGEAPLALPSVS